jgi:hypothetical protein
MVGEPYLNFGPLGIVLFFILSGWCLGRLDCKNPMATPNLITLSAVLVWPFVRCVRDDLGNFVKPVVFALIVVAGWRLASRPFLRRPSLRAQEGPQPHVPEA